MKHLCACLVLTLISTAAVAHTRSESWSRWFDEGNGALRGEFTVAAAEVTRLAEPGEPLDAALNRLAALKLSAQDVNSTPCELRESTALQSGDKFLKSELNFACATTPGFVRVAMFLDSVPGHTHIARFGQELFNEQILSGAPATINIGRSDGSQSSSFAAFLNLGMQHIASGADHLAFLLALLLIARGWRQIVTAISGFTLGHSVTLGLATLGYVRVHAGLIEAFIGFTIFLVALEYVCQREPERRRVLAVSALGVCLLAALVSASGGGAGVTTVTGWTGLALFAVCYLLMPQHIQHSRPALGLLGMSTAFGLIHGFGFAGFLVSTGIRDEVLALALLGFNLGVEIGQLIFMLLALLIVAVGQRLLSQSARLASGALIAAGLAALGVYWFIERSAGA